MNVLHKLEDFLDKITPKVEVTGNSKRKFNPDEFHDLMNQLISDYDFTLRSRNDETLIYILNVSGRMMGELSQAKVLFGKEPTPEMYSSSKSRFECRLMENGIIEINSFEHLAGFNKKVREAFREVLSRRLENLLEWIDKEEKNDIEVEETS